MREKNNFQEKKKNQNFRFHSSEPIQNIEIFRQPGVKQEIARPQRKIARPQRKIVYSGQLVFGDAIL